MLLFTQYIGSKQERITSWTWLKHISKQNHLKYSHLQMPHCVPEGSLYWMMGIQALSHSRQQCWLKGCVITHVWCSVNRKFHTVATADKWLWIYRDLNYDLISTPSQLPNTCEIWRVNALSYRFCALTNQKVQCFWQMSVCSEFDAVTEEGLYHRSR